MDFGAFEIILSDHYCVDFTILETNLVKAQLRKLNLRKFNTFGFKSFKRDVLGGCDFRNTSYNDFEIEFLHIWLMMRQKKQITLRNNYERNYAALKVKKCSKYN